MDIPDSKKMVMKTMHDLEERMEEMSREFGVPKPKSRFSILMGNQDRNSGTIKTEIPEFD